jgi:hypothetical protein
MPKRKPAQTSPQYAKVEQPFGMAPLMLRCPICGMVAIESERCPHLAFVYLSACGEFEYQSAEFAERFGKVDEDDFDLESFGDTLKTIGYGNQLLAIEVTYGGMACGPVWYTDVYGFDFGQEGSEEDEEE